MYLLCTVTESGVKAEETSEYADLVSNVERVAFHNDFNAAYNLMQMKGTLKSSRFDGMAEMIDASLGKLRAKWSSALYGDNTLAVPPMHPPVRVQSEM